MVVVNCVFSISNFDSIYSTDVQVVPVLLLQYPHRPYQILALILAPFSMAAQKLMRSSLVHCLRMRTAYPASPFDSAGAVSCVICSISLSRIYPICDHRNRPKDHFRVKVIPVCVAVILMILTCPMWLNANQTKNGTVNRSRHYCFVVVTRIRWLTVLSKVVN